MITVISLISFFSGKIMGNEESINSQDISTEAYDSMNRISSQNISTKAYNFMGQDVNFNNLSYKDKCKKYCRQILNKYTKNKVPYETMNDLRSVLMKYNAENTDEIKHTDILANLFYEYITDLDVKASPHFSKLVKYDQRIYRIVVEKLQNKFNMRWVDQRFRHAYVLVVPSSAFPKNMTVVQEILLVTSIFEMEGRYNKERLKYLIDNFQDYAEELCKVTGDKPGSYRCHLIDLLEAESKE